MIRSDNPGRDAGDSGRSARRTNGGRGISTRTSTTTTVVTQGKLSGMCMTSLTDDVPYRRSRTVRGGLRTNGLFGVTL